MPEGADWSTVPALMTLETVITDGRATTVTARTALAIVLADGCAPALATLAANAAVFTDTHPSTHTALTAPQAVGALVSLKVSPVSGVTLKAGLEASAQAVHLEPVLKEVLLTARAPDGLLLIDVVRHCPLVSVYPMVSLL